MLHRYFIYLICLYIRLTLEFNSSAVEKSTLSYNKEKLSNGKTKVAALV